MNKGISTTYPHDTPLVRFKRTVGFVNHRLAGPSPDKCTECGKAKDRMRNWVGFYAPVINDVQCIHKLDKWIRTELVKRCVTSLHIRPTRKVLKTMGLLSLMKLMKQARESRDDLCTCEDLPL